MKTYCSHCKTEDQTKRYWINSRNYRKDGSFKVYYWCEDCRKEKQKNYYHNGGKAVIIDNIMKSRKRVKDGQSKRRSTVTPGSRQVV